jgi:hypothetical protein
MNGSAYRAGRTGRLLTLSTQEAIRVGYAKEIADEPALLAAIGFPVRKS